MSDNEKLIEEARTFRDAGWFRVDYPSASGFITRLADALEAAEKAHTPTDDERIVRASIHGDVNAIRALGRLLGRSVVPEPSADDAVRRLKESGVSAYGILSAVTKVYEMGMKA